MRPGAYFFLPTMPFITHHVLGHLLSGSLLSPDTSQTVKAPTTPSKGLPESSPSATGHHPTHCPPPSAKTP